MNLLYDLCERLASFTAHTVFGLEVFGRENLVNEGPALLAMNHQSFFDPPLAAVCSDRQIHFLARKSLFDVPVLGPLIARLNVIGVDRDGNDMSALRTVIRVVKGGGCTIIFPEGTRTRDGGLQPAQPGIGLVIAKTLAPVVPVRVFGAFDAFPRSSKLPRRVRITVVIGRPLRFTEADMAGEPRTLYQQLADRVMEAIAAIELPPGRGV